MVHQKCPICGERLVKGGDAFISMQRSACYRYTTQEVECRWKYATSYHKSCFPMHDVLTDWMEPCTNKQRVLVLYKFAYVAACTAEERGKENLRWSRISRRRCWLNGAFPGIYQHTSKTVYVSSYEDLQWMLDTSLVSHLKDIIETSPTEYMYKEKCWVLPGYWIHPQLKGDKDGDQPEYHKDPGWIC